VHEQFCTKGQIIAAFRGWTQSSVVATASGSGLITRMRKTICDKDLKLKDPAWPGSMRRPPLVPEPGSVWMGWLGGLGPLYRYIYTGRYRKNQPHIKNAKQPHPPNQCLAVSETLRGILVGLGQNVGWVD
jgi:hypothetical protein